MKIHKPIGSTERLREMFQGVNKMNLNENALGAVNPVEAAFDDLVANNMNIEQVNNQVNGDESIVEIAGNDKNGTDVVFKFAVQSQATDQEGVNQIQDVRMISAVIGGNSYDDDGGLAAINANRKRDLFDAVSELVEFESDVDTVSDEMYEDAVKFIDRVPYKKGTEQIQTSKAYGDEKPTNPDLRVKAPELDQFVTEIQDYVPDEEIEQDPTALPDMGDIAIPDDGTTGVDPYDQQTDFSAEPEVSPEKAAVINQAYDNIVNAGNPSPTQDDIMREIANLQGNIQPVEKTRAIPKGAEAFWESTDQDRYENVVFMQGEEADEALEILRNQGEDAALQHLMQWHQPGSHMGNAELGHGTNDQTYEKDGYIMSWSFPLNYIGLQYDLSGLNEDEDDYPKQLGKKFKPKRQIPKKKKKPQSVVKLSEGVDDSNRDSVIDYYYSYMFQDENIKANSILQQELVQYFPMGREELSQLSNEELQHIWDVVARVDNEQNTMIEEDNESWKEVDGTMMGPDAPTPEEMTKSFEDYKSSGEFNSAVAPIADNGVINNIEGGLGDDKELSQFCPIQVAKGVKVEMEHTDNPLIAVEIVMDHLVENPHYYGKGDEDPEAAAMAGAQVDAEKQEDEELTDELLGFKPLNVGDEVSEKKHPLADVLDSDGTEADLSYTGEKGRNLAEEEGFTEYMGDVGDRYRDANDNEFTVRNKVKGGVTLQGQGGEKEVATSDLLFFKKT